MISNIETTGVTDEKNGNSVMQSEGNNVVSAKNVMIPQIYCHTPKSWPSDQYCNSYKMANKGSRGGEWNRYCIIPSGKPSVRGIHFCYIVSLVNFSWC